MSDGPAAVVAATALAALVLVALLVPGAVGRDETDVSWPPFLATYETKSVSGGGLGTTRFAVDWRDADHWVLVNTATGFRSQPPPDRPEAPSSWLRRGRYTDIAIATTRGMTRRDLPDGSIELVQVMQLECPPDTLPELVRCRPGRDSIEEVTTTRLGEQRLPTAVTVEYDGSLVGAFRLTAVDWR